MDSGMFYGIQKGAIAALQLETSWFSELNKVYARTQNSNDRIGYAYGKYFRSKKCWDVFVGQVE